MSVDGAKNKSRIEAVNDFLRGTRGKSLKPSEIVSTGFNLGWKAGAAYERLRIKRFFERYLR